MCRRHLRPGVTPGHLPSRHAQSSAPGHGSPPARPCSSSQQRPPGHPAAAAPPHRAAVHRRRREAPLGQGRAAGVLPGVRSGGARRRACAGGLLRGLRARAAARASGQRHRRRHGGRLHRTGHRWHSLHACGHREGAATGAPSPCVAATTPVLCMPHTHSLSRSCGCSRWPCCACACVSPAAPPDSPALPL